VDVTENNSFLFYYKTKHI